MMQRRISATRFCAVSLALSTLCAAHCAWAQFAAMPEGMKGWWFNITWRDALVESIDSANGGVRYEYEQATAPEQGEIAGMARLAAVHFNNRDGALISSRRYHHEHELLRYLLTGVTDENNTRFATYAYNGAAQAVLSEHAGGAGRYTFAYPADLTRRVTDPLGTERAYGISYASDGIGRITSESQPAGAGSGPGATAFTYGSSGDLASSTDFNGHKTCFVTEPCAGWRRGGSQDYPPPTVAPLR